jgi:hypothetical protein
MCTCRAGCGAVLERSPSRVSHSYNIIFNGWLSFFPTSRRGSVGCALWRGCPSVGPTSPSQSLSMVPHWTSRLTWEPSPFACCPSLSQTSSIPLPWRLVVLWASGSAVFASLSVRSDPTVPPITAAKRGARLPFEAPASNISAKGKLAKMHLPVSAAVTKMHPNRKKQATVVMHSKSAMPWSEGPSTPKLAL